MNTQEQFEALYAEYTQSSIEYIVSARLNGGGYCLPSISKAWTWYRFGTADGYSNGKIRSKENAQ